MENYIITLIIASDIDPSTLLDKPPSKYVIASMKPHDTLAGQ